MSDEELTTMSSREVGARMRKIREQRGISKADLAARVGATEDQLDAWEAGQGVAPYLTIRAIAEALSTTVDAFVG
ncbi:MAG: helix-turn-helix transcriptional regulator [Polyangiaceae bacterium]